MDFILVLIALYVHGIFIFNREWLYDKKKFITIGAISLLLFLVSHLLSSLDIGNPKFIPSLRIPLLALAVFFIMKSIFFHFYDRNPEDTFWSMDMSLMKDGIFNFLFWFFGIMIPMFLIYHVHI